MGLAIEKRLMALAFLAAIAAALLLRDEPGLRKPVPGLVRWTAGGLLAARPAQGDISASVEGDD